MKRFCLLFLFTTLMTYALADEPTFERWKFVQALDALNEHDTETFQQLTTELQNYPLYHYLRYKEITANFKQVSATEIQTFIRRYGNSYFGKKLRENWLFRLAKQNDWENFLRFYKHTKSVKLQCYNLHAQLVTGRKINLQTAKELWLVDHSQPKACNFIFAHLYRNSLIPEPMIWQRIELAAKKRRFKLINSIAKNLFSENWVQLLNKMHKKPNSTLANFAEPDSNQARKIILYGVRQLAKKHFIKAKKHWLLLQSKYNFSAIHIGELERDIAIASIGQTPKAFALLTAINKEYLNEKASMARIKLAMQRQDWTALADFITELPEKQQQTLKWRYWLARALEKTNKLQQANKIYRELAKQRDYYGFLAADHLGTEHKMQHKSIILTQSQKNKLMQNLSIAGAYEFYRLSQTHGETFLIEARREWNYAMNLLDKNTKAIAAALISEWGWHHQAIVTVAQAGHYDDLDIRFPLLFYPELKIASEEQDVYLPWIYGVVRQESAFKTTARSRAGALGLMQLMPATGRLVAKQIGIKLKNRRNILDIGVNVSLGAGYLRKMLDKFDGNYILASAAYNAGPGRAKRWANKNGCIPADVWVELIPFRETRKYVSRVLFYTSVYENKLGKSSPLKLKTPGKNCN
ncbi:transglycosylase SLT domain-containing protein [Thiotrichales bacterium HSG1]|nr:transglycosylase SLT domain-containing protein [Thiotrichales bacterium HSG1]